MRIRWERIVGIILLIFFLHLFYKLQPFLANVLDVVNQDFGYDTPIKAIMLGVLCLSFVAGIKLTFTKH